MISKIYPDNPNPKEIERFADVLTDGGVVIYPTDTVYSFGCSIYSPDAIERIAKIKGVDAQKYQFTLVFNSISQISQYTKSVDNKVFKLLRKNTPGPFTFILNSNNELPKHLRVKSKTIGVRIPNNNIPIELIELIQEPIISTSVYLDGEEREYMTDPELMHEKYHKLVDLVVDGGYGNLSASTIVDCSGNTPEIIRQGLGELIV